MTGRKDTIAITLKALLAGWVTIVFGTSTLIYFFTSLEHEIYHSNLLLNILRNIWEIADEMGPAVKLSIVIVLGILVHLFRNTISKSRIYFYLSSIAFAIISVLSVLALLPVNLSRGYGIGLTGTRFDTEMMPVYLIGAILGGIVLAYVYIKLSSQSKSSFSNS